MYPAAGHIMTGNLKIISDSRIRYIVSKGPKYRFPSRTCIDFKKCREEIASALNDFGNRWCKREYVEPDALKEWKVSIFKIVDQRIKFYSQNTNLLPPKPKSTFRHLKQGRFGPGRFGLCRFGPGSFRPNLVGRFGLIFSKSPGVRFGRLKKNVMREWGKGRVGFGYSIIFS